MKQRIAILFGGVSSEHDVSLRSAAAVIRGIDKEKYDIFPIGITKNGRWLAFPGRAREMEDGSWYENCDCVPAVISPDRTDRGVLTLLPDGSYTLNKIDAVFPVLHGKNGEDGTVQGLLAVAGIPFVGPDTYSSAVCMDKDATHIALNNAGIKTAKHLAICGADDIDEFAAKAESTLGFPMFVKPANAGSSVGISKVSTCDELKKAIMHAFTHDRKVVVEEMICGKEIECAVLGNARPQAAELGEVVVSDGWYDFDAKYVNSAATQIPANVSPEVAERVKEIALKAFKMLCCKGMARVDFFVDGDNIVLNEVNTIPGFTSISMYAKMWDAAGVSFTELIDKLIELAVE
jgi:D-alanine--D-alanine ligase